MATNSRSSSYPYESPSKAVVTSNRIHSFVLFVRTQEEAKTPQFYTSTYHCYTFSLYFSFCGSSWSFQSEFGRVCARAIIWNNIAHISSSGSGRGVHPQIRKHFPANTHINSKREIPSRNGIRRVCPRHPHSNTRSQARWWFAKIALEKQREINFWRGGLPERGELDKRASKLCSDNRFSGLLCCLLGAGDEIWNRLFLEPDLVRGRLRRFVLLRGRCLVFRRECAVMTQRPVKSVFWTDWRGFTGGVDEHNEEYVWW